MTYIKQVPIALLALFVLGAGGVAWSRGGFSSSFHEKEDKRQAVEQEEVKDSSSPDDTATITANTKRKDDDDGDNEVEDEEENEIEDEDDEDGKQQAPQVTPPPVATGKIYTAAQVSTHANQSSCWSIVDGSVYDLTSWIGQHPGGDAAILGMCGKDGSGAFHGQHGTSSKQANILASMKIGALAQ